MRTPHVLRPCDDTSETWKRIILPFVVTTSGVPHTVAPSTGLTQVREIGPSFADESAGVPVQHYVHRNDMVCGSTIGPMTAARLGIPTVDVGAPQLSMHSARELMGVADADLYRRALTAFLS